MFNKVILTFSTRILTALLSVVNVLIGTNYLGLEGYGTISLIVLGITVYLMIQNLLTGASIIYYISKIEPSSIAIISYIWSIVSVIAFSLLIFMSNYLVQYFGWNFEIVPKEYMYHNIFLAFAFGLMAIHLNILLGRERIKAYNFIFFLQHSIATILLVLFYVILKKTELFYYLIALYVSYFVAFLSAFVFTLTYIKSIKFPSFSDFKTMLKYGIMGQSANVFQLINYRLSYYLIDIFVGRASLGIFSAATQISEGLWIFGKSIATVLFAKISNLKDHEYAKNLTIRLLKFTTTLTLIPLLFLMLVPVTFYVMLLGPEFIEVRNVIRWLALGTLALTASMMLSNYFSGIGKISKNTSASGLGVVITILFGFILIPIWGINAAAMVSSISYLTSFVFLAFLFKKEKTMKWRDWLLSGNDIKESWHVLTSKVKKKNS